jgi:hypothetical protein
LEELVLKEAGFLFFHYVDIYNLVMKYVDTTILEQLMDELDKIESGECDQHEGSYLVGKYLKELYIDDVLRRSERNEPKPPTPTLEVTWSQFKTMNSAPWSSSPSATNP